MTTGNEPVAYEYEVRGPLSNKWQTHISSADEVPANPEGAWRDGHEVRNIRPLVYADGGESDE